MNESGSKSVTTNDHRTTNGNDAIGGIAETRTLVDQQMLPIPKIAFGTYGIAREPYPFDDVDEHAMKNDHSLVNMAARTQAGLPLKNGDALFNALIENAFEIILILNSEGIICYANASIERVLGYSPAELIGMSMTDMAHRDDVPQMKALIEEIMSSMSADVLHPHLIETCFLHKNGSRSTLESTFKPLSTQDAKGIVVNSRDITERKHVEALRAGIRNVFEMIATDVPLPTILEKLLGVVESQCTGTRCAFLLPDAAGVQMRLVAGPGIPFDCVRAIEGTAFKPDDPVGWIDIQQDLRWADYLEQADRHGLRSCYTNHIFSSERVVLGLFNMYFTEMRQPTENELKSAASAAHLAAIAIERIQANEKIGHMAYHDALTGLPNRILLKDRLNQAIIHANRIKDGVAVLFIDLDQFKHINDSLGHEIGDRLLQLVAQRLQYCMRKDDTLARFGGDEFILALMSPADGHSAALVAEKILDTLQQAISLDGHELHVSCSIGISLYPNDGEDVETLMRNADIAMYHAKERGRGNFQYFTSDLNIAAQIHHSIAHQLRHALSQNEFVLEYQCQVDMKSGAISGMEALIRWRQPERGLVSPLEFISIAEDTGQIVPIGEWVLREACTQLKYWRDAGYADLTMSINLSERQVMQHDIVELIKGVLQETGLPAAALILEIAENVLMLPLLENVRTLNQLNELGVQLSLDDFGTGYTSLAHLQNFSLHALKIDRSFISGIGNEIGNKAITNTIIAMADTMHLQVIAEGVETSEQALFLQAHGCHAAQGFYYCKPVPSETVTELLRKQATPLH